MIIEDKKTYLMKNHLDGAYYDLDEFAYDVWNFIDGKRALDEITEETRRLWDVKASVVKETILSFAEVNAFEAVMERAPKKRVTVVSPFQINVRLVERSWKLIEPIHRIVRPLLRRPLLWMSLAFIGLASIAFAGDFTSIFADKKNFEILGSTVVGFFVYYFIVLAPAIALHELSHGLALVHYGGRPTEMGTGLFYFGPMFYINCTDSWTLSRRQRIMVFMAGILSMVLIGSTIVVAIYLWQFPASISHTLSLVAFWCFYGSLWDLAPPFETDGYYVLSDLLNIPNLRHDAYDYLKAVMRRAFGRPVKEEPEGLTKRRRRIFIGYAVLSVVWIVYTAYQSLLFLIYMGIDATTSFYEVSGVILFAHTLDVVALVVGLVSIFYFTLTLIGYGVMFNAAAKKATVRTLRFESFHDMDLSVFLYLPTQVPKTLVNDLEAKIAKAAKKFTPKFEVKRIGPLCVVVLRIGSTKLALVQIREHLRKIEHKFSSMYQNFLKRHMREIHESVGIYGPRKIELTNLLEEMAEEAARAGTPAAKSAIDQIIERQTKVTLYLLNSVFATVWTIELPPSQQREIQEKLLPTLFIEDLAVTDLYDEVEDFKKRIIYGFDSLAKLAVENQKGLQETLAHPEKYHVVSFLEPVKSRLVFVGRTEEIEEDIGTLGSLFVCQAWCSYLDHLLGETNLALSALSRAPSLSREEVRGMKNGELTALSKNLSTFVASEKSIHESLKESQKRLRAASRKLDAMQRRLKPTGHFKIGLLDAILAVNEENMANLPNRFKRFGEVFKRLCSYVRKVEKLVEEEHQKRKPRFLKRKQRLLTIYPLTIVLSAILAFVGLLPSAGSMAVPLLTASILSQVVYWAVYYMTWRSFHAVGRYPSPAFDRVHLFVLALVETVYKFIASEDILTPTEASVEMNKK